MSVSFVKAWPFLGAAAVGAALLAKHAFVKPIVSKPTGCAAACRAQCAKQKRSGGSKKRCHGKGAASAAAAAAEAKAAGDFDVKKTSDHNYVSKTHDPKVLPSVCDAPAVFHQFLQTYVKDQWTPAQRELYGQINAHTHARMSGSPDESVFLAWLARTLGARRIVEVGVFMGATTLALAAALPDGDAEARVYALDTDKSFTDFGVAAWTKAGLRDRIDLRLAPAADSMAALADAKGPDALAGKVDLVFIDANKTGYDVYYELALQLLRVGGVVAIDNVYWHGAVADAAQNDPDTTAIRAINAKVIADKRVSVSTIPIADGLTLCRKL